MGSQKTEPWQANCGEQFMVEDFTFKNQNDIGGPTGRVYNVTFNGDSFMINVDGDDLENPVIEVMAGDTIG